jgi:hypothetical protein
MEVVMDSGPHDGRWDGTGYLNGTCPYPGVIGRPGNRFAEDGRIEQTCKKRHKLISLFAIRTKRLLPVKGTVRRVGCWY